MESKIYNQADVILINLMNGHMDSLEICQRIKENSSKQQTIFLFSPTVFINSIHLAGKQAGADCIFFIPYSVQKIEKEILQKN